jgi:quinol monooxygenase YgiN
LHVGYDTSPATELRLHLNGQHIEDWKLMPKVQLIARHTITPGEEEAVFAALAQLIGAARAEPGNLAFEAFRSMDDERSYVLLERYASREALAAHRDTPHFHHYVLGEIAPRLASRVLEEYDVRE